ncbi:hypothetical protein NE237_013155 [Protea cynaroides]|uniref:Uncharacterized protein n=1 Tax=Protea cynaroides TaxID=273540 RepID=A0A9Q0JYP2_9MAGN|nr:hypothetical protein NE237_013155 [Protea cynaroides]
MSKRWNPAFNVCLREAFKDHFPISASESLARDGLRSLTVESVATASSAQTSEIPSAIVGLVTARGSGQVSASAPARCVGVPTPRRGEASPLIVLVTRREINMIGDRLGRGFWDLKEDPTPPLAPVPEAQVTEGQGNEATEVQPTEVLYIQDDDEALGEEDQDLDMAASALPSLVITEVLPGKCRGRYRAQ